MTSYVYATSAESAAARATDPTALLSRSQAEDFAAQLNGCQRERHYSAFRVEHEPVVVVKVEEVSDAVR